MIGCRCKVGDGLSRAVLITRKLSGVVFISPHAKKAVKEKPRNVGGAFLRPCTRLTVRRFSKLAQVMGSSQRFQRFLSTLSQVRQKPEMARTLKTN